MDLIVTLDDATRAIYSAFLVPEEGTASTFRALREVFEAHGLPCSLYTDRGSHYFLTPEAGGKVAKDQPTQVGRALAHLGIEHIAAYSPQARGRSERAFATLQDRLPKELALAGMATAEDANRFIRDTYIPGHNARFAIKAEQQGSAFVDIAGVETNCACRSRKAYCDPAMFEPSSRCANIRMALMPSSTGPDALLVTIARGARCCTSKQNSPRSPLRGNPMDMWTRRTALPTNPQENKSRSSGHLMRYVNRPTTFAIDSFDSSVSTYLSTQTTIQHCIYNRARWLAMTRNPSYLVLKAREFPPSYLERAVTLSGLRRFIVGASFVPDTLITAEFLQAVSLTDQGQHALQQLRMQHPEESELVHLFAILMELWWEELLIDPIRTDIEALTANLTKVLKSNAMRICWLFGGLLYRRAFRLFPFEFPSSTSYVDLPADAVNDLLADTPQGVCQIRDMVAGPLGICHSMQMRYLPPLTTIPLWHCPDPSCAGVHFGRLLVRSDRLRVSRAYLQQNLTAEHGHRSAWGRFLSKYDGDIDHYDHNALPGIPWLLGNALSERELAAVLRELLGSGSRELRQQLGPEGRGSPESIVSNFDIARKLQAVLLCSDDDIVRTIERLVAADAIVIPVQEVRRQKLSKTQGGWFDLEVELSRAGVRTVSSKTAIQNARMKRMISEIYSSEGGMEQLDWHLRYERGDDLDERLDSYINGNAPPKIIKDHVFGSKSSLEAAFRALRYGYFALPSSEEEEAQLTDRIIWKLGFNIQTFALENKRFRSSLDTLSEITLGNTQGKWLLSAIRSAAVNFFVDLEDLLKRALSFSTWLLLSDHYGETRFVFNPKINMNIVYRTLTAYQREIGSTDIVQFDPDGRDTLHPLTVGFKLLSEACERRICDSQGTLRPAEGLPGFAERRALHLFPFEHTVFVNDISSSQQKRLLSLLSEVTSSFETSQVANLRNRLEHDRPAEEFPTQQEITAAILTISNVVDKLEQSGLLPLTYNVVDRRTDCWQRTQTTLINYRGSEVVISR
jgi:hypothetical protein